MNRYSILGLLFFSLLLTNLTSLQADTIRHMQYNLLFYTNNATEDCNSSTNNLDEKDAALKQIVKYVMPVVLTVNEIGKEQIYADRILNNVLNTDNINYYGYLPAVSNSSSSITTGNRLFYDTRKFALHSSFYVSTSVAYFNAYKMYYRSTQLAQGDTAFITFIVCHLKAGSTDANKTTRKSQVLSLMNKLQSLGKADNYVLSGDLNLYGASEEAYQTLIHNSNSLIRFYDPIEQEGEWHNNYDYSNYHTQSTHTESNGCASAGGLDDRFDFILVSNYINYGLRKVQCLRDTYHALGQDGDHFNGSINSYNSAVPSYIADALYNMSDHLPVIMDYRIDATVGIAEQADNKFPITFANPINDHLNISTNLLKDDILTFDLYSIDGKLLNQWVESVPAGAHRLTFKFPYTPALYIVRVMDSQKRTSSYKIIKY